MDTFIELNDIGEAVMLTDETILLVQGMSGIDETHTEDEVSVKDALVAANKWNVGSYHPDIYVRTPNHLQVCYRDIIIGFIHRPS